MTRAYIKTLQGMGIPWNPDFNGAEQFGVGMMQHTIDWETRRRCSAVDAFLAPVMDNPLLTIETEATVTRLIMEGETATGVDYLHRGSPRRAHAGTEVILAAGAYQTPKLLMLSGIGPESELARHAIRTLIDLPGVGQNLQDHYECPVVATTRGAFGYYGQDRGWPMIKAGLQYLLFRSGPATTTGVETCAFYDPDATRPSDHPDVLRADRLSRPGRPGHRPWPWGHDQLAPAAAEGARQRHPCFSRSACQCHRQHRHLQPSRRSAADREELPLRRSVLSTSPIREMIEREIFPGADITSDEAIAEHCRRTVKTGYHPVGTCRMGHEADEMAVLTPRLTVRGARRLRVIDASIMPTIVSGNTNAAVLARPPRLRI